MRSELPGTRNVNKARAKTPFNKFVPVDGFVLLGSKPIYDSLSLSASQSEDDASQTSCEQSEFRS
jgi:hypothetical protein